MKKTTFYLILILLLGSLGQGCKEDKPDVSCDTNFFEADLNGLPWEGMTVTGFKAMGTGGQISVHAAVDHGFFRNIDFALPCDIKTGDFDLTVTTGYGAYVNSTPADAGNLNVTVHDTLARVIKGTFEFVSISADADVKAGSFCVKY